MEIQKRVGLIKATMQIIPSFALQHSPAVQSLTFVASDYLSPQWMISKGRDGRTVAQSKGQLGIHDCLPRTRPLDLHPDPALCNDL